MRRRDFTLAFGGAAAWPRRVLAQSPARRRPFVAAIWLSESADGAKRLAVELLEGMRELGRIEGRDLTSCNAVEGATLMRFRKLRPRWLRSIQI
jgi:hypothetical protein